jgi:hypothetical protein
MDVVCEPAIGGFRTESLLHYSYLLADSQPWGIAWLRRLKS